MKMGLYTDIDAKAYHADPCVEPSLSSSVAATIIDDSPRHGWIAHPRLNPTPSKDPTREMEVGTAVHALLLGRGSIVEIEANDYKTAAAKEKRAAAYKSGVSPILSADLEQANAIAEEKIHLCG